MYKLKKSKYLILIPTYNELNNLKKFLISLNRLAPLCILDDCSTDRTTDWLLKNKINFIKNRINLGYERNLLNGIKKFKNYCEFLITFDGDGQHKLSDIKRILKKKHSYDIIICNRKNKNRFLEEIISYFSYLFFGLRDPISGFKIYKTSILKKKNFEKIGEYFLADFLFSFVKNSNIGNLEITTKKRADESRVGGFASLSLKELKILLKIITIKTF